MNVASSGFRYCIIITFILFRAHLACPMVMDNRYFPWLNHLYTASDHTHGHLEIEGFFITGGEAYRCEAKANKEEQIVTVPELYGELKLADVATSMQNAGLTNPIPSDWQWLSDFKATIQSSLEGQGMVCAGYAPITKRFGLGASTAILRLNSLTAVTPHSETVSKLSLTSPGNQARFSSMMSNFYKQLSITHTTLHETMTTDSLLYCSFHDVREYQFKMRKIDWGIWVGLIIPTGAKWDQENLASIPFGGNGLWGLFVAPRLEFELKEDLKFGLHTRITKRLARQICHRIPIGDEQILFAPFLNLVHVDPGVTFTTSAYITKEDLRAGLGMQAQYTITYHEEDSFDSNVLQKPLVPNFKQLRIRSGFISEYLTARLCYDVGHDKAWKYRPLITFAWDIPVNYIAGKAFAKTHKISLGCTVNF